jgi:hypothetical protein
LDSFPDEHSNMLPQKIRELCAIAMSVETICVCRYQANASGDSSQNPCDSYERYSLLLHMIKSRYHSNRWEDSAMTSTVVTNLMPKMNLEELADDNSLNVCSQNFVEVFAFHTPSRLKELQFGKSTTELSSDEERRAAAGTLVDHPYTGERVDITSRRCRRRGTDNVINKYLPH